MKNAHEFNQNYALTVVLIHSGLFVQTFDKCAYVICALTGYQLIEQKNGHIRCGFNEQSICDVKTLLVKNKISFVELQTSPANEQAELIDSYDAETPQTFETLCQRGEQIFIARKRAAMHINYLRDQASSCVDVKNEKEFCMPYISKEGQERSAEWEFINDLCQGRHPFDKTTVQHLSLNDPQIIRGLFAVRDKLERVV